MRRQARVIRPSSVVIALLLACLVALSLSSCTVSKGVVKNVWIKTEGPEKGAHLEIERCDLVVYLALYGLIATEENCHVEHVETRS